MPVSNRGISRQRSQTFHDNHLSSYKTILTKLDKTKDSEKIHILLYHFVNTEHQFSDYVIPKHRQSPIFCPFLTNPLYALKLVYSLQVICYTSTRENTRMDATNTPILLPDPYQIYRTDNFSIWRILLEKSTGVRFLEKTQSA